MRNTSPIDDVIGQIDAGLRTVFGQPMTTGRANPSKTLPDTELSDTDKKHTARLMRINHTGEVCAQALYQGQAFSAKNPDVKLNMEQSAAEENDHLEWCENRIKELDGRTSLLNPIWYSGSFAMGALAGAIGDKWSLGFVAETEKQVEDHLEEHLQQVPKKDKKTHAILEQMKVDEIEHGAKALHSGGVELPSPVKALMQLTSKVMTKTVYHL